MSLFNDTKSILNKLAYHSLSTGIKLEKHTLSRVRDLHSLTLSIDHPTTNRFLNSWTNQRPAYIYPTIAFSPPTLHVPHNLLDWSIQALTTPTSNGSPTMHLVSPDLVTRRDCSGLNCAFSTPLVSHATSTGL